jgi:D-aminopeptidase
MLRHVTKRRMKKISLLVLSLAVLLLCLVTTYVSAEPRARALGIIPGYFSTGPFNAITDVPGVKVGQVTLNDPSKNMHTGVTAILPHGGNLYREKVPAGFFQANGYGKMMGISQVVELGEIETPILLTNTLNVAENAQAIIDWTLAYPGNEKVKSVNAIVGETNDGRINDIRKRFINKSHALEAINIASSGIVQEGNVGAGTGTVAFGYKAGIGTSSRVVGNYTLGVLVQANYGGDLHVLGVPVGRQLKSIQAQKTGPDGSVMVIVATDAPLSDRNLTRLAKRAILGIGRTGGVMSNGSGDYILAFSTAESVRRHVNDKLISDQYLANRAMTPLFSAVIEATEEAVYNALVAAKSVGDYEALPIEPLKDLLSDRITHK